MKKFLGCIFGMIGACLAEAQVFHSPAKSVYQTGNACSDQFADAFSFTANPAVLGIAKVFSMGLSMERKWMLKELDFYRLAGSFPAGGGGIGLDFHYTGDPVYNESSLAAGYGRNLGKVSAGILFRSEMDHAAGYGNKTDGSVMLGIRFHPVERFYAGLVLSNSIFERKEQVNPEKAADNYNMGLGYEASSFVFISVQFIKEAGIPLNTVTCIDYRWNDQFFASLGIEMGSASPYAKAGWGKGQLRVELFAAYHAVLGFTPGLVLLWKGKEKSG
jgi:hypothetical protein